MAGAGITIPQGSQGFLKNGEAEIRSEQFLKLLGRNRLVRQKEQSLDAGFDFGEIEVSGLVGDRKIGKSFLKLTLRFGELCCLDYGFLGFQFLQGFVLGDLSRQLPCSGFWIDDGFEGLLLLS